MAASVLRVGCFLARNSLRAGSRFSVRGPRQRYKTHILPGLLPSQSFTIRPASTFVSKHFQLDSHDIERYLSRKRLIFSTTSEHCIVKECPFCSPTKNLADNQFKLYVKRQDGAFYCHRCGSKGSWFDFKQRMGDVSGKVQSLASGVSSSGAGSSPTPKPSNGNRDEIKGLEQHVVLGYQTSLFEKDKFPEVLDYLTRTRGLSVEVLRRYGVGATTMAFPHPDTGAWTPAPAVVFPWLARVGQFDKVPSPPSNAKRKQGKDGSPAVGGSASTSPAEVGAWRAVRLKVRSLANKAQQRLTPKGGGWGLFGWHTVPADATELVITEGEYDAMAVHQATGMPAVSLPNGCRNLPLEVLPQLERFTRIILWMDNDVPGQEGAEAFVRKLGAARCVIVRPHDTHHSSSSSGSGSEGAEEDDASPQLPFPKDANDALRAGWDVAALLRAASPLPHKQIATFSDLRQAVFKELSNPEQSRGVPSRSIPSLARIQKGLRRGELTILTGPTGSGKTTLLSQLSTDYCAQGVRTMWGSFEVSSTRLLKTMLNQFAEKDLSQHLHEFDAVADRFSDLPMYFLRFFGSSDVDQVLDAMEFSVYAHDVSHIILDNLQFMMAGQQGLGLERFDAQERALDKFRQFATHHNVHLTLVVHPRKEADDQPLSVSSVFGTAKATQEADNVLIIQNLPTGGDKRAHAAISAAAASAAAAEAEQAASRTGGSGGSSSGTGADGTALSFGHGLKFLEIRKNRFDGGLGSIPLAFNTASRAFVEVTPLAQANRARAAREAAAAASQSVGEIMPPPPPPTGGGGSSGGAAAAAATSAAAAGSKPGSPSPKGKSSAAAAAGGATGDAGGGVKPPPGNKRKQKRWKKKQQPPPDLTNSATFDIITE